MKKDNEISKLEIAKSLDAINNRKISDEEKENLMEPLYEEFKNVSCRVMEFLDEVYKEKKISLHDWDEMCKAIISINEYFSRRYLKFSEIGREANDMIKTFLDPELFRQGEIKSKLDIAKKMLLKGKDVKEIVEFTELTIKDVEALKEEVFQKA